MKKIVSVMFVLMLVACGKQARPSYYEQMDQLDSVVYGDAFTFTHQLVMNEKETLFYAPAYIKIGDNIYRNDDDYYVIRTQVTNGLGIKYYQYSIASESLLKQIFGG